MPKRGQIAVIRQPTPTKFDGRIRPNDRDFRPDFGSLVTLAKRHGKGPTARRKLRQRYRDRSAWRFWVAEVRRLTISARVAVSSFTLAELSIGLLAPLIDGIPGFSASPGFLYVSARRRRSTGSPSSLNTIF